MLSVPVYMRIQFCFAKNVQEESAEKAICLHLTATGGFLRCRVSKEDPRQDLEWVKSSSSEERQGELSPFTKIRVPEQ